MIPAVQTDTYTPKGAYKALGDFTKVYVTGPKSDNAIICVYDIFGYFPQTQQGADIIASALCTTVYMPDFFEPKGAFPSDKHPPKTDEDKAAFQEFFGTTANVPENVAKLFAFGRRLKADGAKKLGVYGFCWGGKISLVGGSDSSVFSSAAIVHPAMLSVDDAEKLQVPLGIYISKDEPKAEYEKIVNVIAQKPFADKNDHKLYEKMHHGWAAARADLKNEANKRDFEDVYAKLVNFFQTTLA